MPKINPKDRHAVKSILNKADNYLTMAISAIQSVNTAGITTNEHRHLIDIVDDGIRVVSELTSVRTQVSIAKTQSGPLATGYMAPQGYSTATPKGVKAVPPPGHRQFKWGDAEDPQQWSAYSFTIQGNPTASLDKCPPAAITNTPGVNYRDLHEDIGCNKCKHALRQYIGFGPACGIATVHQGKRDPHTGKCLDYKEAS